MLAEQLLLLLGGKINIPCRVGSRAFAARIGIKSADKFARATLEHGRDAVALVGSGNRGYLRHQVEIEKLDELKFDLPSGRSRLEE